MTDSLDLKNMTYADWQQVPMARRAAMNQDEYAAFMAAQTQDRDEVRLAAEFEKRDIDLAFQASPLGRFLASLEPMQAGKCRNTLERFIRVNGACVRRYDHIAARITEGYALQDKHGQYALVSPDGSYFSGKDITMAEIRFAAFLLREISR